jgi:trans-2-enoyl-CoA reductase
LTANAIPETGCPFGGPEWQLWVNHTLAHAEAGARGARHVRFAVCAPAANTALLGNGVLDAFRSRLANAETFRFLPLDDLLGHIQVVAAGRASLGPWAEALRARYGGI